MRFYLSVLAGPLERADLNTTLYLKSMKRVEAGELRPLPTTEAVAATLRLLALTPSRLPLAHPAPMGEQPAESADDLLVRGRALNAQNRFAEALPLVQRATELNPASAEA